MELKEITDKQYRKEYDKLYIKSMRAGSEEESNKINAALKLLNSRPRKKENSW